MVLETLKKLQETKDRRLIILGRMALIDGLGLQKFAQEEQHGIFQHFRGDLLDYPTRQHYVAQRGGESDGRDKLYGVGPEHEDSKAEVREPSKSLSTRYSPDRVGVQARRVTDGVYQDPYTNKTYDWHTGFTTETGEKVPGGDVSLQTDILRG